MATSTDTRILASGIGLIVRCDRGDIRLTVGRYGEIDAMSSHRLDRFEVIDVLTDELELAAYQATGPEDSSLFLTDKAREMFAPLLAALDSTSWKDWA